MNARRCSSNAPHFWIYDIPSVNVIHLFSEMPLLGYSGYLPFGIQCWVWWLLVARVLNVDPSFEPERASSSPAIAPAPELQPSLAG